MPHLPRKTLAGCLLLLCVVPSNLRGRASARGGRQGSEGELIRLLEQVRNLQKENRHDLALPLVERALAAADKTLPREDAR